MMHADMPHSLSQEVIDDSSGACWRRWGAGSGRVVCCASSRLLRPFTLRYASFSRTVEGQEA